MRLAKLQDGMIFQFTVYNKDVRAALKDNTGHRIFGDHWADVQIYEIVAADETAARTMIDERYPPDDGFVAEILAPANQ
jgi:hypothetical protein